nr:RLORF4 [Gallid alphaherpesvirus 2]WOL21783.1 RLORF4 [Gallid alphaherpesvirus 2]WOL21899.1 RLORF4 [Gallid alphaherpesvirus 2]
MRTAKFIVVLVFCYAGVVGIFSYTFKGPHSLVFQYYHLLMQTPVHFSVSML